MKGIVLATVSCVALLTASAVNAEEAATAPATLEPSAKADPKAGPADSAAAVNGSHANSAAVKSKVRAHKKQHHAQQHHAHHPRAHHHPRHHYMEPGHRVPVERVYVTFPPINECGQPILGPAYYWGNPQCPYLYHGGYFWYPHARADMLKGYTPYYDQRWYWYASRTHPHAVYIDRTPLAYTHPYPLHMVNPMDRTMYRMQGAPMQKKWEDAPELRAHEER